MRTKEKITKKEQYILDIVVANQPIYQSEILQKIEKEYENKNSARKNISYILSRLKNKGFVSKTSEPDPNSYIYKNIWSMKK